jgi:putative spermidine/putrescine transport system substrate-binding protein
MFKRSISNLFIFIILVGFCGFTLAPVSADSINYKTCRNLAACGGMNALIKAAQEEGTLNINIALRNWANYGEAIDTFQAAFGIRIVNDNPDGNSSYAINAIKTASPQNQPDVINIGASRIPDTVDSSGKSLFTPYQVQNWNDIPALWREPDGLWFGGYQGQVVIGYDTKLKVAPKSFKDVLNPMYEKVVGMGSDPRAGQSSLTTVMAASVANGGSLSDVRPGIEYFRQLKKIGNLSGASTSSSLIATGSIKVWFEFSFNAPGTIQMGKQVGKRIAYVKPSDAAVLGTPYVFGVNAKAPHPAAARLWVEYLLSQNKGLVAKGLVGNESTKVAKGTLDGSKLFNSLMGGQNIFQLGGAIPMQATAMKKKRLLVTMPSSIFVSGAGNKLIPQMPTSDQQTDALTILNKEWGNL